MFVIKVNEDITLSNADAIVNASNGVGYMGGKAGIANRKRGVAEGLHYESKGAIEPLAKAKCKTKGVFGYAPGNIFITNAPNLHTKNIIHAVTMRFPGSKAKIKTIKKLTQKILEISEELNYKSVAVPLLGTGTGGLDPFDVIKIYFEFFKDSTIKFEIYHLTNTLELRYKRFRYNIFKEAPFDPKINSIIYCKEYIIKRIHENTTNDLRHDLLIAWYNDYNEIIPYKAITIIGAKIMWFHARVKGYIFQSIIIDEIIKSVSRYEK